MGDDHIELVVKLKPDGDPQHVRKRLEGAGLSVMPMTTGFLLSGARSHIEKALALSLKDIPAPASLPVPADLADHIENIALPGPRSYHA